MLLLEAPKVEKRILPSLVPEQINYLIEQAEYLRDKATISLFADSGARLNELTNIQFANIDWDNRLIKVFGKGGRERYIIFGERTASYLKEWLKEYQPTGNIWGLNRWNIIKPFESTPD